MRITPYTQPYQQQVASLIVGIQNKEFGVDITADDQPDLKNIEQYYQNNKGNFWIALQDEQVLGTIALVDIDNQQLALRKMFVKNGYRGQPLNIGQSLLNTAINWAKQRLITEIYLGTVPHYYAAHRFYEKNDFYRVSKSKLPANFNIMEVDKYFYCFQFESYKK